MKECNEELDHLGVPVFDAKEC